MQSQLLSDPEAAHQTVFEEQVPFEDLSLSPPSQQHSFAIEPSESFLSPLPEEENEEEQSDSSIDLDQFLSMNNPDIQPGPLGPPQAQGPGPQPQQPLQDPPVLQQQQQFQFPQFQQPQFQQQFQGHALGVVGAPMPARNHSSAPKFDPSKPRDLPIYFQELELLLANAQIIGEQEKKENARRYLQREDFELWGSLPEFDAPTTYEGFKAAVRRLYPGATEERKYCLADIDRLTKERYQLGIQSLEELSAYYRQFLVMTTYLLGRGRMADVEQKRRFIRGFQPGFSHRIAQRLQLLQCDGPVSP